MYGIHPYYDAAAFLAVRDGQLEHVRRNNARHVHLAELVGRRRRRRLR